jgi:hypothetical protein
MNGADPSGTIADCGGSTQANNGAGNGSPGDGTSVGGGQGSGSQTDTGSQACGGGQPGGNQGGGVEAGNGQGGNNSSGHDAALVTVDANVGSNGINVSAEVLPSDTDAHHAALISADVDVGHDITLSASLLNVDLLDVNVGLDFGHDAFHA